MFERRGDELFIEELSIDSLADTLGTPLYLYSTGVLRAQLGALREALPSDTEVLFSIKANPNPHVVALFGREGAGAEIASRGELEIAQRAGIAPARIVFAGPGKTDRELAAAVEAGVHAVNVESLHEARRLDRIAARLACPQRVCLRINPSERNTHARMRMGGTGSPFGVDESEAFTALAEMERLAHLRLVGIHFFSGTQVLVAEAAAHNIAVAVQLGQRFAETLGRSPEIINVGPGLGIPVFDGDPTVDLGLFRDLTAEAWAKAPAGARLLVEAGRFLTADAGIYVATVLDVKRSQGVVFAVLDGGMHHHATGTGGFGNVFRKPFPVAQVRQREGAAHPITAVGPCCTSLDLFGRELMVTEIREGDRLAVLKSGAYGLSTSPLLFLSHETPLEVLVEGTRSVVIRDRVATGGLFVRG